MEPLLERIRSCTHCEKHLPLGPRPVLRASATSTVCIIGQAPGTAVHRSGIPWDDPSGRTLRAWLDMGEETFYDDTRVAIVPMGFCYPGKGKSGDLPPRPECAPMWHEALINAMPKVRLTLLIGQYAQRYYLKDRMKKNLTETVRSFRDYGTEYMPLPHPSPRNRLWLRRNPWFEEEVVPALRTRVREAIEL